MRFFLIIGVIIWLVASSEGDVVPPGIFELLKSEDMFEREFFEHVAQRKKGSFACSPLSLWLILSQAAFGARGRTEKRMKTTLRLPAFGNYSNSFRIISKMLQDEMDTGMDISQKMFLDKKIKPKDEFRKILSDNFMTRVANVDFNDGMLASRAINEWSATMTQRQVKNVTRPTELSSSTSMVLVSSVYFKSTWRWPFYPKNTEKRNFRVNLNRNVSVLTMCAQARWAWASMPEIEADFIELEYEFKPLAGYPRMIIILPWSVDGLAKVERKMKDFPVSWFVENEPSKQKSRQLCLPKFKIKSKIPLNSILRKMKMRHMFSKIKADFSGISDSQNISVSNLIHNVIIEVDEEGVYENESDVDLKDSPEPINVDHPFLGFVLVRGSLPIKLLTFRYTGP